MLVFEDRWQTRNTAIDIPPHPLKVKVLTLPWPYTLSHTPYAMLAPAGVIRITSSLVRRRPWS
jgi:hypothetical protein